MVEHSMHGSKKSTEELICRYKRLLNQMAWKFHICVNFDT